MRSTGRVRTRGKELLTFCRTVETCRSVFPDDKRTFCKGHRICGELNDECKECKAYKENATQPVKGEAFWIIKTNGLERYRECSACGTPVFGHLPDTCPICGKKMQLDNLRTYI